MKKIIGIVGVAVIAAAMFFTTNKVNGSGLDTSLASLIGMNAANAESTGGDGADGFFKSEVPEPCTKQEINWLSGHYSWPGNVWTYDYIEVSGTKIHCLGIGIGCVSTHCI